MKIYAFFNPENLRSFLAEATKEFYLSYVKNEKYYGEMQVEVDIYKYEVEINDDFIIVRKKNR